MHLAAPPTAFVLVPYAQLTLLRPNACDAMALDRPRLGQEPDAGTCNALHIHLVEYACEELSALADDSEDEQATTYDQQAEQLMCAGGTPCNKDLLVWMEDKMPAMVFETVLQEAARVEWPFLPAPAVQDEATPPVIEQMSAHPHWPQLKDVIRDSMRVAQGGGKLRRVTAEQRRASDLQADELAEEPGNLQYDDALLLVGRRLQMPVDDVIHEWNFEVDWQSESDAHTSQTSAQYVLQFETSAMKGNGTG